MTSLCRAAAHHRKQNQEVGEPSFSDFKSSLAAFFFTSLHWKKKKKKKGVLNLLVFCANISKGKCVIRKENLREDQLFLVRFCQFFRERARASFLSTSPGWKEKASRPPVSASTNDENVVTMWKQVAVIACHTSFPTPGKGDRRTPACSSNKPGTAPKHLDIFSPWSKICPISWCFKRLACVPSMRERHIYSSYFFDPALHLTAGESHHHIKNRGKKKKKRQELSSRDHFSSISQQVEETIFWPPKWNLLLFTSVI